jgi:hypothetical protein
MHILFVDESGTAPEPAHAEKSPKFVLGGIVISEETWPKLRDELEIVKRKYSVNGEIKWRYFLRSATAHHFTLEHLTLRERDSLRRDLFEILGKYHSVRFFAVVVETEAAYKRDLCSTGEELYQLAFKLITEQFQSYLDSLEEKFGVGVKGMVVADNRNQIQDAELREFHHSLISMQSENFPSRDKLIEGLFFAASHLSVGTQFADLVAGAVYRKYVREDREFWEAIQGNFASNHYMGLNQDGVMEMP